MRKTTCMYTQTRTLIAKKELHYYKEIQEVIIYIYTNKQQQQQNDTLVLWRKIKIVFYFIIYIIINFIFYCVHILKYITHCTTWCIGTFDTVKEAADAYSLNIYLFFFVFIFDGGLVFSKYF